MTLTVAEPTAEIVLNATELEVSSAIYQAKRGRHATEPCIWTKNSSDAASAFRQLSHRGNGS